MGIYLRAGSLSLLLFISMLAQSYARPVSFADSWMVMQENSHTGSSVQLSYSPTWKYSLGVRTERMNQDAGKDDIWGEYFQADYLAHRWNQKDSQGNLFLLSGIGSAHREGDPGYDPAAFAGIEADWETRRLYFMYENRLNWADTVDQSFSQKFRAGFAPWLSDYEGIHPWLILQVDHHPEMEDNVVLTPIVRLYNPTLLTEFGVSNHGDVLFNWTYQF